MRSNGLRYTVIGLVLVLLSAAGGFVIAGALDDDSGPSREETADSSTTAPAGPGGEVPAGGRPPDGQTIVATNLGLLGWWDGDSWVGNDGAAAPLVPGLGFTYLPLEGEATAAVGAAPTTACGISDELPHVELDPDYDDDHQVAVSGVSRPLPRRVEALDRSSATYEAAASEALASVGITDPAPTLAQLLRIDLDGDGSDEVLITAERIDRSDALGTEAGEYTAVILRQLVDGQVRSQVVAHDEVTADEAAQSPYVLDHRIAAIADLDGDGTLEVVLGADYYEGASYVAFALDRGQLREVLSVGCGA